MRTGSRVLLGLFLSIAAGACATHNTGAAGPSRSAPAVTVEVANEAWNHLNIFVVRDENRHWLGGVSSAETRTFSIPRHLLIGTAQLMASATGSQTGHLSEPVTFVQGRQAHWKLIGNPGSVLPRMSIFSYTAVPTRTRVAKQAKTIRL